MTDWLINTVFEWLPVVVAAFVFVWSFVEAKAYKDRQVKSKWLLATLLLNGSIALTLATLQILWWDRAINKGELMSTVIVNHGWTIHNLLTMVAGLLVCCYVREQEK